MHFLSRSKLTAKKPFTLQGNEQKLIEISAGKRTNSYCYSIYFCLIADQLPDNYKQMTNFAKLTNKHIKGPTRAT